MARATAPDTPERNGHHEVNKSRDYVATLPAEIASRFLTETTEPTADQTAVARQYAFAIAQASEQISQIPDGRYRSLALTSLEEALMWANKAVFS